MRELRRCRLATGVLLIVGLLLTAYGTLFMPALPHVLLDVVLSPEELQSPETRERTLELLSRVSDKSWWIIGLAGFVVAGIAFYLRVSLTRLTD